MFCLIMPCKCIILVLCSESTLDRVNKVSSQSCAEVAVTAVHYQNFPFQNGSRSFFLFLNAKCFPCCVFCSEILFIAAWDSLYCQVTSRSSWKFLKVIFVPVYLKNKNLTTSLQLMCKVMKLRNIWLHSTFVKYHIAHHEILFHKLQKKIHCVKLKTPHLQIS